MTFTNRLHFAVFMAFCLILFRGVLAHAHEENASAKARLISILKNSSTFENCKIEVQEQDDEFGVAPFGLGKISTLQVVITMPRPNRDSFVFKMQIEKVESELLRKQVHWDSKPDGGIFEIIRASVINSSSKIPGQLEVIHNGDGKIRFISFNLAETNLDGKGPSYSSSPLNCRQ